MDKDKNKNKGLADNGDGEFILNESGTSVTIDEDFGEDKDSRVSGDKTDDVNNDQTGETKDK